MNIFNMLFKYIKAKILYDAATSYVSKKVAKVEDKLEDAGIIERKSTGPGILLGALAGLAIGAVAALLLAKQSGENFRSTISTNFNKAKDKLSHQAEETLKFAKRESENVKKAVEANTKEF